jgi:hypothetical protein
MIPAAALSVLVTMALAGCAKSPQPQAAADMAADADHDHAEGEMGHDHEHNQAEIDAALAKLSPEEKAIAESQGMMCVVSDEPLGSMGAPVLVKDVGGHNFLICCAACEEELRKNPDKYIAKLKKPADAQAEPAASEPAAAAEQPEGTS